MMGDMNSGDRDSSGVECRLDFDFRFSILVIMMMMMLFNIPIFDDDGIPYIPGS
jgi:hypothetical protein